MMKPGDRLFLEAPKGRVAAFQQQVGTDIRRAGCNINQTLLLAIEPRTREVYELVMLTRKEDDEDR